MSPPLASHPLRRVVVPVMAGVGDAAERCFDVVPAPLVVEPAPDQLSDECAALSRAGTPVEFSHEFVVQSDVQPHGPNLAHTGPGP